MHLIDENMRRVKKTVGDVEMHNASSTRTLTRKKYWKVKKNFFQIIAVDGKRIGGKISKVKALYKNVKRQ